MHRPAKAVRSGSDVRRRAIAVLLACAAAGPAATRPTTKPAVALSPAEQVQFQQTTVEAQVRELQDRMFHLADLTRQAEPDDSARLLMAVRKAREDLILEQVRDVLDQLSHQDFSRAVEEQQQVLVKLEQLKRLLTSTDLDLQMQMDRLKKLNAAIAKLDPAIKEQRRQQKKVAELAAKTPAKPAAAKPGDAKPSDAAKQDQAQNHRAVEAIAQALKDLGPGPAAAAATLGGATQDMSLAEGLLAAANPGGASPLQGSAGDQMQKARDQLEKERQKILDELAKQVRKQVVENLAEMLDRQKSVRGATAALAAAGGSDASASDGQDKARQLSSAEAAIVRIGEATLELVEQTQFSVALPAELKAIGRSCESIGDRLGAGTADRRVVGDQVQVEHDLADLLDTFKQLASNPGPNPSECKGCKGNKNKLLAELKVIRVMQQHVNRHTAEADADRGAGELDENGKARVSGLSVSQAEVHDAAEAIHQQLSGE